MARIHLVPLTAGAFALLAAVPALAQSGPWAAGLNLGTPGIGVEGQYQVSPGLNLRADGDWLSISRNRSFSGTSYGGRLKSTTGGLFLDWHPMGGGLLLSGGGYFGKRRLDINATPPATATLGGIPFTAAQVGRLSGQVKFSDAEPFAGVGWDNTFVGDSSWSLRAIAGVAFSSEPKATLVSTGGTLSGTAPLNAALAAEQSTIAHDTHGYRYYPVLQVGVTHRF